MSQTDEVPLRVIPGAPAGATPADEATRYLCAAAHIDIGFAGGPGTQIRQSVKELLLHEPLRAAGVSPGVDLRRVAIECERAEGRKFKRDLALLAVLGLMVLVGAVAGSLPAVALLFLLAVEIVHVEAWISTHRIVARTMLRGQFESGDVQTHRHGGELGYVESAQKGNVTVYSGYSPFAGVGYSHGGWSLALNLAEGARGLEGARKPQPISIPELYARVASDVADLGVPNLETRDHVFVDGRRLREDPPLLMSGKAYGRPDTSLPEAEVQALVGAAGERLRHYKVVRVNAWGGELVLSVFVRFMKVEQALFAEASYFLLPPLNDACHIADRISPTPGWRDHAQLLFGSLLMTPLALLRAFGAVGHVFEWRTVEKRRKEARIQAERDPSYDFGAPPSVRQNQASGSYRQYFQQLDRDMYLKVIERRLLDSLTAYLDEHDIDTADLRVQSMTVMNNGVMINGGTRQTENVAVGAKSRAQSAPKAA